MERSGSQKALLVFSIIQIICSALVLVSAIMMIAATGLIGAAGAELTADEQQLGAMTGGLLSIILVIAGVWGLLCGIFGIRAANDNQKIMIVWVFLLIELILTVVSLVMSFTNGDFGSQPFSYIVSLVLAIAMFVVANNIKKEAGK